MDFGSTTDFGSKTMEQAFERAAAVRRREFDQLMMTEEKARAAVVATAAAQEGMAEIAEMVKMNNAELAELRAITACVVCKIGRRSRMPPCNHLCMCEVCATHTDECPVCKTHYTTTTVVFT